MFDSRAIISDKAILDELGFKRDINDKGEKVHSFRLNYPQGTDFKGNETKALFRKIFNKHQFDGEFILNDPEKLKLLWHIVYSLKEEAHIYKAIKNNSDLQMNWQTHFKTARIQE